MRSLAACLAVCLWGVLPSWASDSDDVKAAIRKWVADFNKADFKAFVGACAPRAAVVDGFPPYAWQSCGEWIADYEKNNKALQATHGTLTIGNLIFEEIAGDRAYVIYPATFTDMQKGKEVVYKGTWTMTLRKGKGGWVFTGSASAWGVNTL
jgi:ketosteroid isomerase-like protein